MSEPQESSIDELFSFRFPVFIYDIGTLAFLAVNEAAVERYGYSHEQFSSMSLLDIGPAADGAVVGRPSEHRTAKGETLLVETIATEVVYAGRRARASIAVDVTERVRTGKLLQESENNLREAQRIAHLGSFTNDLLNGSATWSEELCNILGRPQAPQEDIYGRSFTHPDDWTSVNKTLRSALKGDGSYHFDHRIVRPTGEVRWVQVDGHVDFNSSREPSKWVGTVLDITARKEAEAGPQYLASKDYGLSGLPNQITTERRLAELLVNTKDAYVLFVRLDGLDIVSDAAGYTACDQLVEKAAQLLNELTGEHALIGQWRYGQFVVSGHGGARELGDLVARVQGDLSKLLQDHYGYVHVGIRMGIALHSADIQPGDLIRKAALAAHQARSESRIVRYFEPGMESRVRTRFALEHGLHALEYGLRRGIEDGELSLYAQPIFDAQTERMSSVEVLLRWNTPTHGLLSPASFMETAETTGLIIPIGAYVLNQACALAKECERLQIDVPVAINVSAKELGSSTFVSGMQRTMAQHAVQPSQLILELTESALTLDIPATSKTLTDLRGIGLRIAIDDFGTGYNSLIMLKHFRPDILKLDRAFIQDYARSALDKAIVDSTISLGESVGSEVIAEGVETLEQVNAMREAGVTGMQGFYFGHPMPPAEFLRTFNN